MSASGTNGRPSGLPNVTKKAPIIDLTSVGLCCEDLEQCNLHFSRKCGFDELITLTEEFNPAIHFPIHRARDDINVGDLLTCCLTKEGKLYGSTGRGNGPMTLLCSEHEDDVIDLLRSGDHIIRLEVIAVERRIVDDRVVFTGAGRTNILCIDKLDEANKKIRLEADAARRTAANARAVANLNRDAAFQASIGIGYFLDRQTEPVGKRKVVEYVDQTETRTNCAAGSSKVVQNNKRVKYENCKFTLDDHSFDFYAERSPVRPPNVNKDSVSFKRGFLDILEEQRRDMYYKLLAKNKGHPASKVAEAVAKKKVDNKFSIFDKVEREIKDEISAAENAIGEAKPDIKARVEDWETHIKEEELEKSGLPALHVKKEKGWKNTKESP